MQVKHDKWLKLSLRKRQIPAKTVVTKRKQLTEQTIAVLYF
jgi:hypothetical protein